MVLNMVKEDGDAIKKTPQISMTESTKTTKRMVKVFLLGLAAMSIKVPTKTTNEKGLEKCSGLTAPLTRETGLKEFSMDEER